MNLRAYHKDNDVTAAECIKTAQCETFFGKEYVSMVERLCERTALRESVVFGELDARHRSKKYVSFKNVASLYGQRPYTSSGAVEVTMQLSAVEDHSKRVAGSPHNLPTLGGRVPFPAYPRIQVQVV